MSGTISVISFSESGFKFQESLKADICQWAALQEMQTEWYCKDKSGFGTEGTTPVTVPTKEWSANRFEDSDIIIYFCTVAKAVRNFAPSMKGQLNDPAVLAIDQLGRYSIPILSGKKGEAYELSLWLEEKSGITAVNSGRSVSEHSFSIAEFARKNDLVISNDSYAKEISAALDSGEKIGFYTEFPVKGDLPEGMDWAEKGPLGINLGPSYHTAFFVHTLWLIPRCLEIGIELSGEQTSRDIDLALTELLKNLSIYPESIASVHAPESETLPVLENYCSLMEYPLHVHHLSELDELKTVFPSMEYYECAALKSGDSRIIARISTDQGIRIAVAQKKIYVDFEA